MMSARRLFVPEVVQTSAMDCGPACLKALLEGYQISTSYDVLRQACQTDVDGTSIDTMEVLANELGLVAEQIMVPLDHLLLSEAEALPAIVVVRLPNSLAHFVVVWRQVGRFLQVMDPANGREWMTSKAFLEQVHVHAQGVGASDWRDWAASEQFLRAVHRRARKIQVRAERFSSLVDRSLASADWRPIATLDAALRMLTPIVGSRKSIGTNAATNLLERFYGQGLENPFQTIPPAYWSVLPARDQAEEQQQLVFRGAILLRVTGRRQHAQSLEEALPSPQAVLSTRIQEALQRPAANPMREVVSMLRADGLLTPATLAAASLVSAGGVLMEALLFRTFLDVQTMLTLSQQRTVAIALMIGLLVVLTIIDVSLVSGLLAMGRKLEARIRMRLLHALPRLSDRYFSGRPISDMAERSHSIHEARGLPLLGQQLIYAVLQLVLTTVGVLWLDSGSALPAIALALFSVTLPLLAQPLIAERDLRFRTHTGALCTTYLDALRGLIPLRTHGASGAMQCEHESLLVSWAQSGIRLQAASVAIAAVSLTVSFGLVAWLLMSHFSRMHETAVPLLLVYWALSIPLLGSQVAQLALQYPRQRNLTSRLLEPLGQSTIGDEASAAARSIEVENQTASVAGMSITFESVTVRAMGHTILEDLDLTIAPGSHVCIIGASGAGKSSLVGLLLGFHTPASGHILVDEKLLQGDHLEAVRMQTAWLDPNVQLWNRSLFDNLLYGTTEQSHSPDIGAVLEQAELTRLIEKLPDGLSTKLGESGALVSGGEGQRVRFGRALLRPASRLAILDEPFSGLDRRQRRSFLHQARRRWQNCTLLCVTHDVSEAAAFDRVLVLDHGRLIEDGFPKALAEAPDSTFRRMLDTENTVCRHVWSDQDWRKVRIANGRVTNDVPEESHEQRRATDSLLANVADR